MSRFLIIWHLSFVLNVACLPMNAAEGAVTDLLFVVANPASLTSAESARKTQFETWGYTVTLIDDGASQTNFNTAAAANNVAYVSSTVVATTVGTKLKSVTIGVINEHLDLANSFGFSTTGSAMHSKNFVIINNNTHHITYGLVLGNLTILDSNQTLARRTSGIASGATNLAQVYNNIDQQGPGLLTINIGGALYGGGTAAGRRVQLPVGSSTFNYSALNSAGLSIFWRAIEWAARPNPSIGKVLLVVTSTSAPTAQETLRQMQIDAWGYDVTLIAAGASQSSFDSALAGKDAVYISREVSPTSVGTKLTGATIGIVSEEAELSDEFGMSSNRTYPSASSITVTDNSHAITAGLSTGSVTLFTSSAPLTATSGTLAPGLQTLATISGAGSLVLLEAGAVLTPSGIAAGRRVQLPWGGSGFDLNSLNANGKTLMRQAIEWAAVPPGTRLLMVVANSNSLHAQELARKSLVESWSYSVNILDDDATQSHLNLAVDANEVVYISERIVSTALGTKLRDVPIGIVNEEHFSVDDFEIATSQGIGNDSVLSIVNGTHYITAPLGSGPVAIFNSSQPITSLDGSFASGMQVLGQWGYSRSLVAVEAGAKLLNNYRAVGRRVQLPWGQAAFDINELNASGELILQRSLEWAAALVGYWKLDETDGTLAADSSQNALHGTLFNGPIWTTGKVAGGLEFDGVDDYVDLGNSELLNITGDLTLSAWVKFQSIGTGNDAGTIITWANGSYTNYPFHWVVNDDGTGKRVLRFNHGLGAKDTVGQILPGTWHHVAATISDTTLRLYIDGQPDVANPHTLGTRSAGNGYCTLGRAATQRPHAMLDDVRVYKYAMSEDEIQALKASARSRGVRILKWVEVR